MTDIAAGLWEGLTAARKGNPGHPGHHDKSLSSAPRLIAKVVIDGLQTPPDPEMFSMVLPMTRFLTPLISLVLGVQIAWAATQD